MKEIPKGTIETSSLFSVPSGKKHYLTHDECDKKPEAGDVIYGKIQSVRQHSSLENKVGRIHSIHDNTRALFVFANRYATDYYEAVIPNELTAKNDLIARSGMIGNVINKNEKVTDPTQVKVFGYVCDSNGNIINTRNFSKVKNTNKVKKNKMILSIGTNMNSGKTTTAAMCCWTLAKAGHSLTASKVTGTASLKDILLMQDSGASKISDFTYFGHPSTYLMSPEELTDLFLKFDGSNNEQYWVVEFADGILQRETKMLLQDEYVKSRIGKLIFNAHDTFSAIGGLKILKQEFGYDVDAVSGVISGSPLLIKELSDYSSVPVINNMSPNAFKDWLDVIL